MKRKNRQRNRNILGAVCLSAALSIFAGALAPTPASAQQNANPYAPEQPLQPLPPPSAPPPPQSGDQGSSQPMPPPVGQMPSIPPPVTGVGQVDQVIAFGNSLGKTLADYGIYLSGSYTEDISSLISGGVNNKTGTIPNGEFTFGAVFDLQKILGVTGGSLHVTFDERNGFGPENNVGTSTAFEQAGVGPTRATRLSELYYEQSFYNDRIDIQIGRTNPTLNFATSDLAIDCSFVGGYVCAQPATWYSSNQNDSFPGSTWGGFLNIQTTQQTYFRTGIYDDDPSQNLANQQGFNFNVHDSVGVFVPLEIGYQTTLDTANLPGKFDVGGYWDDADYTLPNGVNARGRTAYYGQFAQTVWRPNPQTHQSLTIFGGAIVYTGGSPYWSQAYAGVIDRAPFGPVRPDDSLSFIGSYYANSANEHPNGPNQWSYEVDYNFQVVPGITFKPFTQYIVAPNNLLNAFSAKEPKNAFELGFQVSIDFTRFFGLPQFVAY
jgi:porin